MSLLKPNAPDMVDVVGALILVKKWLWLLAMT
jgi:hypothetical protein